MKSFFEASNHWKHPKFNLKIEMKLHILFIILNLACIA